MSRRLAGADGGVDCGGGGGGGFGVAEDFAHEAVAFTLVVVAGSSGEDIGKLLAYKCRGTAVHEHFRHNAAVSDKIGERYKRHLQYLFHYLIGEFIAVGAVTHHLGSIE